VQGREREFSEKERVRGERERERRERERKCEAGERERESFLPNKIRGFICLPLQQYSVLIPSTVALCKILSNLR
jgi:hypothetical protein